jgi:hypothetical protein
LKYLIILFFFVGCAGRQIPVDNEPIVLEAKVDFKNPPSGASFGLGGVMPDPQDHLAPVVVPAVVSMIPSDEKTVVRMNCFVRKGPSRKTKITAVFKKGKEIQVGKLVKAWRELDGNYISQYCLKDAP